MSPHSLWAMLLETRIWALDVLIASCLLADGSRKHAYICSHAHMFLHMHIPVLEIMSSHCLQCLKLSPWDSFLPSLLTLTPSNINTLTQTNNTPQIIRELLCPLYYNKSNVFRIFILIFAILPFTTLCCYPPRLWSEVLCNLLWLVLSACLLVCLSDFSSVCLVFIWIMNRFIFSGLLSVLSFFPFHSYWFVFWVFTMLTCFQKSQIYKKVNSVKSQSLHWEIFQPITDLV